MSNKKLREMCSSDAVPLTRLAKIFHRTSAHLILKGTEDANTEQGNTSLTIAQLPKWLPETRFSVLFSDTSGLGGSFIDDQAFVNPPKFP